MASFKELLEKVTDPELKASMQEEFDKVNQQNGERGRKLIEKDGELNTVKAKAGKVSEYEASFQLLKEAGVELKDIPAMLEKFGKVQTAEDESRTMKMLLKEEQSKTKQLAKEVTTFKVRSAIDTKFSEARKNFKTETGEAITIVDDFIDFSKLYEDINVDNEVLLTERANTVLKDAFQKQEAIKTKMGFQGAPTHKAIEGSVNVGGENNVAALLQKTAKEAGPTAALSEYYKLTQG